MTTEENRVKELEKKISELEDYIFSLKPVTISPASELQLIRKECREKYFGTWKQMQNGETSYGPSNKKYSDYDTILNLIAKATGLLFKYSCGKSMNSSPITSMVRTEEDRKKYREICDMFCKSLLDMINMKTVA